MGRLARAVVDRLPERARPIRVLGADHDTRFLVLEIGACAVGHLTFLCGIAPPRVGVMVNVGVAP